jgi:outer membrane protein OmpA-like peptidoglycan-associated protein
VIVHFFPNSADVRHKVIKKAGEKEKEELYDPNVDFVIDEIGKLAGQYGAARIVIEGHTDASMKGQVPFAAVAELSRQRAESVRAELLKKFPSIQPNQVGTEGMGWNKPADETDPLNGAKNRRVEVKVYPLEAR